MTQATSKANLEAQYHRYIDALNERRYDEAARFYHDEILFGDQKITCAQWKDTIERQIEAIPDFQWKIVIDGNQVGLRVMDTGTLVREFSGLKPNGRPMVMAENIFYRLQDGRISELYSICDWRDARFQLESAAQK